MTLNHPVNWKCIFETCCISRTQAIHNYTRKSAFAMLTASNSVFRGRNCCAYVKFYSFENCSVEISSTMCTSYLCREFFFKRNVFRLWNCRRKGYNIIRTLVPMCISSWYHRKEVLCSIAATELIKSTCCIFFLFVSYR